MTLKEWIYRVYPRARWLSKEIMLSYKANDSILNIGAGYGYLEKNLEKHNIIITSLEPIKNNDLKDQITESFEKANFDKKFDKIIFSYSFHHLDNPTDSLAKALSLLTVNGKIFILEIAPKSLLSKIFLFDSRILCQTRKNTWTKSKLEQIILVAGGKIMEVKKYSTFGNLFVIEK